MVRKKQLSHSAVRMALESCGWRDEHEGIFSKYSDDKTKHTLFITEAELKFLIDVEIDCRIRKVTSAVCEIKERGVDI